MTTVSIISNPPATIAAQNSLKPLRPSHEAIMAISIIIIFQQTIHGLEQRGNHTHSVNRIRYHNYVKRSCHCRISIEIVPIKGVNGNPIRRGVTQHIVYRAWDVVCGMLSVARMYSFGVFLSFIWCYSLIRRYRCKGTCTWGSDCVFVVGLRHMDHHLRKVTHGVLRKMDGGPP